MLKIYDDKQKILRTVCNEVSFPYSEEDKKTLKDMVEYLKKSQDEEYAKAHQIRSGIGLAAPQIGLDKRMFAICLDDNGEHREYGLINPKILRTSVKRSYLAGGEGCLSVNEEHQGLVMRYYKVVMQAYDALQDKDITITAYGYLAIALQHEYDHLDGVLFYDRINKRDPFHKDLGAVEV
jgi:peptide deformylase